MMNILRCAVVVLCILQFVQGHEKIFPSSSLFNELPNASGPEALAFDGKGRGPYAATQDGRILEYHHGQHPGFSDFATTSPYRTNLFCDGAKGTAAATCGRPLGLAWNFLTDELYVVDSTYGFLVVSRKGGLATQIAANFECTQFGFLNALDIDQENQIVYFTDSGAIFHKMDYDMIVASGDTSGKLYKYDIKTKEITLLLDGLSGSNGVAVSEDGTYLVISEFIAKRIRIFWLEGPQALTSAILIDLPGTPDNIKRTISGDFWVPMTVVEPPPAATFGVRFNGLGNILEKVDLTSYLDDILLSEVQEQFGYLYLGSLNGTFVGKYHHHRNRFISDEL